MVDVIDSAEQPAVNAYTSRMFGIGAIFGYWFAGLDLVYWTGGYLGSSQLKVRLSLWGCMSNVFSAAD